MKKLYKMLTTLEVYFLFALFLFTAVAVVVNVLGRKFLGFSFNWLEEFARYVLIIITFIGISIATTRDIHPKMDAVQNIFKGRAKLAVQIIAKLIFSIAICLLAYYALRQFANMLRIPASTATLKIPLYTIYAFLAAGLLGASVRSIIDLGMTVRKYALYKEERREKIQPEGKGSNPEEGGRTK